MLPKLEFRALRESPQIAFFARFRPYMALFAWAAASSMASSTRYLNSLSVSFFDIFNIFLYGLRLYLKDSSLLDAELLYRMKASPNRLAKLSAILISSVGSLISPPASLADSSTTLFVMPLLLSSLSLASIFLSNGV